MTRREGTNLACHCHTQENHLAENFSQKTNRDKEPDTSVFVLSKCCRNVQHLAVWIGPLIAAGCSRRGGTGFAWHRFFPYETNVCCLQGGWLLLPSFSCGKYRGTVMNFKLSHTQVFADWVAVPAVSLVSARLTSPTGDEWTSRWVKRWEQQCPHSHQLGALLLRWNGVTQVPAVTQELCSGVRRVRAQQTPDSSLIFAYAMSSILQRSPAPHHTPPWCYCLLSVWQEKLILSNCLCLLYLC